MPLHTTIGILQHAAKDILNQKGRLPQDALIAEALYNWASSYGPHMTEPYNARRSATAGRDQVAAAPQPTTPTPPNAPPAPSGAPVGRQFPAFAEWRQQHEQQQQADDDPFDQ